ncbi:MAG TPA: cytochrome C [Anseongella sp.]|nr:cytochrome C [Anseongella sp.]
MKKAVKILLTLAGVVVILAGLAIAYVKLALPNVGPAPVLTVELSPERIARGKYLANNVSICIDCHSARDWSLFTGPIIPGTEGRGGEEFPREMGFPGDFYSANITPSGISDWSDGELFRAITTGVDRDGKALFPVMPFAHYGKMDPEDIKSIIAYLRTLKPVEYEVPASRPAFPMSLLLNTIPQKAALQAIPDKNNKVAYGGYLVNAAACAVCHTPAEKGQLVEEMMFAGGRSFPVPGGTVTSTNITPHEGTGIGTWDKAAFI